MTLLQDTATGSPLTITGAPEDPGVAIQAYDVTEGSFESEQNGVGDSVVAVSNSAGSWKEYLVFRPPQYQIESLNPVVAGIDGNLVVRAGGGGFAAVRVTDGLRSKIFQVDTRLSTKVTTSFDRYQSGTLSKLLSDSVLELVAEGRQPNLFLGYNPAATTFTLNPDCYLHGIDFSGVPVATTLYGSWGNRNRGALITPQHVVGAVHYKNYRGYDIGDQFKFRGNDGEIHVRHVVGKWANWGDMIIVTLDSPLPVTCTPLQLAGDWIFQNQTFGPNGAFSGYSGGVAVYLDQGFNGYYQLVGLGSADSLIYYADSLPVAAVPPVTLDNVIQRVVHRSSALLLTRTPSMFAGKTSWLREAIVGDSGSPVMLLIGGKPVLLGTWWYPTDCMFIGAADGQLANAAITASDANAGISTGLTVTVAPDPTL